MKQSFAFSAALTTLTLFACASQPLDEALQPQALKAAQARGASELGCPDATAEVLSKHAVQPPPTTGWYEAPRRAEYTIGVSGCGKRTTYAVGCNKFGSTCEAGPVPAAGDSGALQQLADELKPGALKAAEERAAKELACQTTTAEVVRQETIIEGQTTGWSAEAPHRAAYAVTVKGCGKQTGYLVECDTQQKGCATAGPQQAQAGPQRPQLADELQPGAVKVAQERGAKDLACPAAAAQVNRKATIEEGQTTGWYEAPNRALYTITVAGCGKETVYLVACNKKENRCAAGIPGNQ
jgi:hypothetical protein